MAEKTEATLPSFRRVWDHLVKDKLHTSTLSVCIFSAVIPTLTFISVLLFEIYRRKAGVSVTEAFASTFWPTFISALVTALVWAVLLGWALKNVVIQDKQELLDKIAHKESEITKLDEIMTERAEDSAKRINEAVMSAYEAGEQTLHIKEQLHLTEEKLYASERELAAERDRASQPDIGLLWDWPEGERLRRGLMGDTEKEILVHNRSNEFVYNVQIETVPLRNGLSFDPIREIGPNTQYEAVGRWNDKSSVHTNYHYFFVGAAEEAETKGWIFKKAHNRGIDDTYWRIPMAVTYESHGIRWRWEFDFIYDFGQPSEFVRKTGTRLN